jgi:hypothetical protein
MFTVMEKTAAFHGFATSRHRLVGPVLLAMGAMLLICLGPSPAQAAVGQDGQIHACYRVKGKPKGTLRVVRSAKARCRRGERKAAWSVAGSSGIASQGAQGVQGPAGGSGSSGDEAALKAQVGALSLKVEALEGILQGITNGDLTGMLATLGNVTNPQLLSAIGAVPLVEEVCGQTEELTGRSNALLGLLDALDVANLLSIPSALPTFDVCPAP